MFIILVNEKESFPFNMALLSGIVYFGGGVQAVGHG